MVFRADEQGLVVYRGMKTDQPGEIDGDLEQCTQDSVGF